MVDMACGSDVYWQQTIKTYFCVHLVDFGTLTWWCFPYSFSLWHGRSIVSFSSLSNFEFHHLCCIVWFDDSRRFLLRTQAFTIWSWSCGYIAHRHHTHAQHFDAFCCWAILQLKNIIQHPFAFNLYAIFTRFWMLFGFIVMSRVNEWIYFLNFFWVCWIWIAIYLQTNNNNNT